MPIRIIALATVALGFIFSATAQQQPSVSEMLAGSNSLGTGWEQKIYLLFDSAAAPAEIIQTAGNPPQSALKNWRRGVQDANGKISGWVLAHYSTASGTNGPKYEVHLERFRSHDALLSDFEKLLETAEATPGSCPLKQIGDAAFVSSDAQGTGVKVWFRRGNFRVWISPVGAPRQWNEDTSLHLLAQAIDQRIVIISLGMRGVADGAALLKHALEEQVNSPHPGAIISQQLIKAGGAFVPISKASSSNTVSFVFDHWKNDGTNGDALAIFRLTNSDSCSIVLWNVLVQNPGTRYFLDPSGWETIQDGYPSATSAVCETGSSIEFSVGKPIMTPWRACILYSRELSDSDRPKDSQRTWGGNYEVIGQPVH
ncbi:MAG TPA: hypothetical protein VFC07_11005 [Verrucomicrobiae bacterium]|nr:hypothetical protein [Verrucomicrobiae bacterium]